MNKIRKALVAAAGSGGTALVASLGFGLADGHLSGAEVLIAIGAACTAAAAVGAATWRVPNDPA